MKSDIIAFKGVKDGVYLEVKDEDFDLIVEYLDDKMEKSSEFFRGVKFLGVKSEDLSTKATLEINLMLKYKYGFDISLDEIIESMEEFYKVEEDEEDKKSKNALGPMSEHIDAEMTKFVYGTLRSGQVVEYDGHIVVMGDVNPGALLKSKKNIIVVGTLRGVAHAGIEGDLDSIVAAYNLIPSQLRIGDLIVRAPDNDMSQYKVPEVAKICKGEIVIEPYLPNK